MRPNRRPETLHVFADGYAVFRRVRLACALGRGGVRTDKREGDGATPTGRFPVRHVRFRPDRWRPQTALPAIPVLRSHGWSDDPADPLYNRFVRLPHPCGHERLRRADRLYDALIVVGHNDRPHRPGAGSAVFVHVMAEAETPTAGCVAFRPADLAWLLAQLRPGDDVTIHPPGRKSPGLPLRRDLRT
ncbi:MAG: L,D-transpeptidase family protein [Minwuia sp.]|uniref:L,D-transpeptidase family protein n=1 Tax=Minwuia sp. TaxID=2493630 RepID=UPI003A8B8C38